MKNNIKVREEIWKSVSGLSDQQLNEVVEEGKWTIAQVLEHLYLIEKNIASNIQNALLSNEYNPTESKPVHLAANRTRKVDSPKNLTPSNEFKTFEDLENKLTNSRKALVDTLQGVSEDDLTQKSLPHGAFGMLSLKEWVSFIGFHEQRHLEQIEEIKQHLK